MTNIGGVGGYGIPEKKVSYPKEIFGAEGEGLKDIPQWFDLSTLKPVKVVAVGADQRFLLFQDKNGNLLKIKIQKTATGKIKDGCFGGPEYIDKAYISVNKAGTDSFKEVAFNKTVKHKLLHALYKAMPCNDSCDDFLEKLENAPTDKPKKHEGIIKY